jgi:hypothetical protein
VIAVGTTAVRAIESATSSSGLAGASSGWTDLVISPERGVRAVDGIITGLHEPQATHLLMLAAIAPVEHLHAAYRQAIAQGYLWHEFGDMHLILPWVGGKPFKSHLTAWWLFLPPGIDSNSYLILRTDWNRLAPRCARRSAESIKTPVNVAFA